MNTDVPMTFGSLFAGVGGFDMGFERSGMECKWQVEIDAKCREVLAKQFPAAKRYEDVKEVEGLGIRYNFAMKYQPTRKLKEDQIPIAIKMYEDGKSLAEIGRHFDVSRQSMWDLLRRRISLRGNRRMGEDNHFYRGGALADDAAQGRVEKAVLRGLLIRPSVCEQCGGNGQPYKDGRAPIQAHHCDYNKPLEVMWLCKGCHHDWHRHFKAIPKRSENEKGGEPKGILDPVDVVVGGFP